MTAERSGHDKEPTIRVEALRAQFPALRHDPEFIFFDNAAGAQVPDSVLAAVTRHLVEHNVQRGGRYGRSVTVDAGVWAARSAVADLLNAKDPDEVAFGLNATSFIRLVSLGIGQDLGTRDEIVVSDLDHDANVATWMALRPLGARIVIWPMRPDGRLHVDDLRPLLSRRTRLVACTVASHALGSLVDVAAVAALAHAAGAELFLDAVHFLPHGLIDVQAWGCDYLVCSGYKAFAPHMGFLWGRRAALTALATFREDFIPDAPPFKIEAGTFAYESVAGLRAAIDYLAALGAGGSGGRRGALERGLTAVQGYEQTLSVAMLERLRQAGATVFGIDTDADVAGRVPTFGFTLPGVEPATVVTRMAAAGIGVRDGHMYTPRLMQRLGVAPESGIVRASLVHYNTAAEVARFGDVLAGLARQGLSLPRSSSSQAGTRVMIELSRRLLLASLLVLATVPAQAGQELTVGAYPANPPWEFKAADGHFEGFEVDVVNAVAKRLGDTVSFADTGFQALFAGTSSGRIDMAISSITITADRLKSQAFTQPYYDSDGAVLTKAGSPIATIEDLKGKTLGAIAASSGEAYAKANAAKLGLGELKSYNTQDNLMLDVRNGRIDGGLGEVAGFQYAMSKTPGLAIPVRIPTGERFAIMMKKGSPLLGPVNDAIAALKQDGTLAAIHQTWFDAPAPAGSSTVTVLPLPAATP